MKYLIVILLMLLSLNLISNNKKEIKTISNQEIYIKIVDQKTNEYLVGVKNNDKYSNFDGVLKVNKGENISLELVSYEKVNITSIKNDTIIKMNIIK